MPASLAQALARMLQGRRASPVMLELVASLPIAGCRRHALRCSQSRSAAHLKTGSLRDVGWLWPDMCTRKAGAATCWWPSSTTPMPMRPVLDALTDWAAKD